MTAPTPPTSTLVRPFTVSITDSEIDDVKQRLARTRWPDPETVGDWSQGVRAKNTRSLVDYWERGYDWRRFESELNRFPQFLTEIDGLDIHFIHVRSKDPSAMPLILNHGWPGSIVEFLKLIGPLTDPVSFGGDAADSFDVDFVLVAPRVRVLPEAHGDRVDCIAHRKRVGGADEASRLHEMGRARRRLGCRRHHRPRGHATSRASRNSSEHPVRLSRTDTRHLVARTALRRGDPRPLHRRSRRGRQPTFRARNRRLSDSPWRTLPLARQPGSTTSSSPRPTTTGLPRTPSASTTCSTRYPCTGSPTAQRRRLHLLAEQIGHLRLPKLTLPVAVTVFPRDIPRLPRSWIEDTYSNLIHYGEADKGGHSAALEQPRSWSAKIRTGLRTLRS